MDLQPVPGGEGERLHVGQRVVGQGRLVVEQERGLPGLPVPGVVGHRPVVDGEGDQPGAVGVVAAEEGEVAGLDLLDRFDVVGDGGVDHDVLGAGLGERHHLDLFGVGVDMTPLTSYCGSSARTVVVQVRVQVDPQEPAGVGVHRRQQVEAGAVGGEPDGGRC